MPLKASGPATGLREIDRWEGGVGWLAHPEETMRRASHALAADGGVWVVDPLDAPGLDDLLAELGEVAGVVVLLDRHVRDADAVATRHGVPVYVPSFVADRADPFDAEVRRVRGTLADTDFRLVSVVDWPWWHEGALYDGETLAVGDALGTADYFRAGDERLAVHPALRPLPPRSLADLDPERVLVGHGEGVMADGGRAVRDALDTARRNLPAAWLKGLRSLV